MRKPVAAACVVALHLIVAACGSAKPPHSLFDAAGYHVRGDTVFYLEAFPGQAVEIAGADAPSFQTLDRTFARDRGSVYVDGRRLEEADPGSFELLDRQDFARDRSHVFRLDRIVSDDPAHFTLLDGDLTRDGRAVYWSDGRVLSEDPANFAIIWNAGSYLFTRDGAAVHVNGGVIAGADPASFPPGVAVTNCSETSISFVG